MAKGNKQRRLKIYDDFSKNEYHELCDFFDVEEFPNRFYKIITREYGAIDFYPMSDKLNFRKKNEYGIMENYWKPDGLKWIKSNLLKIYNLYRVGVEYVNQNITIYSCKRI